MCASRKMSDWDQRILNAAGVDQNVSRTMVYERHKNWHQEHCFFYERVRLSPHLAQTDFALFFYIFKTALTEILGSNWSAENLKRYYTKTLKNNHRENMKWCSVTNPCKEVIDIYFENVSRSSNVLNIYFRLIIFY